MSEEERQRIDKWLWFARLTKSRTLAQKLATSGGVRVNRERCDSASRRLKVGDVLTIANARGVRVLRVAAHGVRRGPPAEACLLYEDLSPPPPIAPPGSLRERGSARPTKRDRRRLDAWRETAGDDFSRSKN
jgi:ribosome-associated heat shock protein Hsp15